MYLVSGGQASSRERAQELISAGMVLINGAVCRKNSAPVEENDRVDVIGSLAFVGRGGKKLQAALDAFSIDLTGKTVLDIGASTGGFTDCALQRGAASVYAVDVGHGQLAAELQTDPRVVDLEGVHVKDLSEYYFGTPDFICVDVSFLSLGKVLPYLIPFCGPQTDLAALIKPQFEVRHAKSVIRDPKVHRAVLRQVLGACGEQRWSVKGLIPSPIRGTEGNVEFFVHLRRDGAPSSVLDIDTVVKAAYAVKK